jgi:hypothetical protein
MTLTRHTDEQKARAYDALVGGDLGIPESQKAERWDRRAAKHYAKIKPRGDTGTYTYDSDSPFAQRAWCDCGKLRGSENCTCEAAA